MFWRAIIVSRSNSSPVAVVSVGTSHRPTGLNHRLVPARQRENRAVTEFLSGVRCQSRSESTAAIQDYFGGRIGKHSFQIALQNSLAQVDSPFCASLLPLMVFPDV